ncbi:MAG: hypothetical protein AB1801_20065, partial [Chloroflexota bacterium]
LVLGLAFVVLTALLFLAWVLTYWLLRAVNDWLTENWVTESEGLLALVIPALLYATLAWWFTPPAWIEAVAYYTGWSVGKTWLSLIVGAGLLGLAFGFLSLLMLESRDGGETPTLTTSGTLSLPAGKNGREADDAAWDLVNEGVLLGEDI